MRKKKTEMESEGKQYIPDQFAGREFKAASVTQAKASTKFYKTLKKLNRLVWGKKGPKTAFIYSNLVKVGIDIFEQILIQNGYLVFEEDYNSYNISDDNGLFGMPIRSTAVELYQS